MVTIEEDRALRWQILHAVDRLATKGYVEYQELERVLLPTGRSERVVDRQRGIWNPANLLGTLSIKSNPDGPYDDTALDGGLFVYSYEKEGRGSRNAKLRAAYELDLPMILFRRIAKATYTATLPVYVVGDDPEARTFLISLDAPKAAIERESGVERAYRQRVIQQRMHQQAFRGLVLRAYATRCAICTLKYGNLLDAAHIIGDADERGDAVTQNGLSLCKIHHAVYDANIMGIDPQGTVHVQKHFLEDTDGPMLLHGIKEMHGRSIIQPDRRADRPHPDRLAERFSAFQAAY